MVRPQTSKNSFIYNAKERPITASPLKTDISGRYLMGFNGRPESGMPESGVFSNTNTSTKMTKMKSKDLY